MFPIDRKHNIIKRPPVQYTLITNKPMVLFATVDTDYCFTYIDLS